MGAGGTGKAVLAQIAHFSSPRCEGLFVFANCSSDSNIPNDTVWTVECENRFRKASGTCSTKPTRAPYIFMTLTNSIGLLKNYV